MIMTDDWTGSVGILQRIENNSRTGIAGQWWIFRYSEDGKFYCQQNSPGNRRELPKNWFVIV